MNEEQLNAMLQQVMQWLQEGQDPNDIVDQLIQQGAPEDVAAKIVDAAMQQLQGAEGQPAPEGATQGGQGGGPTTPADGSDANAMLDEVLQQLGPNVMLAIFEAYDSLGEQGQEAKKQQLAQMSNETESQQGSAQGAQPQPGGTGEQALFG